MAKLQYDNREEPNEYERPKTLIAGGNKTVELTPRTHSTEEWRHAVCQIWKRYHK